MDFRWTSLALVSVLAASACGRDEQTTIPSAATSAATTTTATSQPVVDLDDPQSCAPCHAAVVAEWNESQHSRAHESRDPIFAGMRTLRMKHEGEDVANKCALCHYPRDAKRERPEVAQRGMACSSCHLASAIHAEKGPGAKALTYGKVMAGPHDLAAGASPVHGTGPAPSFMKDGSQLCLACHNATKNPQGVASCTTGPEWKEGQGDSCVSCHMPTVAGPSGAVATHPEQHRSHAFHGPHRAWYQNDPSFLKSAVKVTSKLVGDVVVVEVENVSQHGFPSGFPGRMVAVVAKGLDDKGAVVWQSAPESPLKDTPTAVFFKKYVDAEGHAVPAPLATKLEADTRLKTGETREVRLPGLPAEAKSVQVQLLYFLLPPPLAAKIGVTGPEAKPKVVETLTLNR